MQIGSITRKKIQKISGSVVAETEDDLIVEEPLEIVLKYGPKNQLVQQVVSITMRTPGNDEELALGFLFTEGIVHNRSQVKETIDFGIQNRVLVELHEDAVPVLHKADRNFYTTSSCGVCGKTSIDAINIVSRYKHEADKISITPDALYQLGSLLQAKQVLFKITGGLHAAALFDGKGNFDYLQEDVGRHNALDKVIGAAFRRDELPLKEKMLFLSGRASFELIQKASMAGIRLVAAVGAPSSLAVDLAKDSGITLVGFLRDNSFNVYSGEHRILIGD